MQVLFIFHFKLLFIMNPSKIVLVLIKCLIEILIECMRKEESNLDPDGVPLNIEEYNKESFLRASLHDIVEQFKFESYEKE